MLRMGRNPKVESNENEKQAATPYAAYNTPAPPVAPPTYVNPEPPAQTEIERPPAMRAVTETETLAREIKDGTMSGFVGGGTVLSGEAAFKGMLRIDGHLTGRINSEKGTLIVSSGGRVDADIAVATAKINGIVNGDIIASERLELGRAAHVRGNIQTPVLVIEQGAIFEGGCRMNTAKAATATTAPQEVKRAEKTEAKSSIGRSSTTNNTASNMPPPVSGKSSAPEAAEATSVAG